MKAIDNFTLIEIKLNVVIDINDIYFYNVIIKHRVNTVDNAAKTYDASARQIENQWGRTGLNLRLPSKTI